ncbi:MAG: cytidylate kinase family protein [Nanoarchaeota archaeon]|nr:cytidylate kinase family protein [Nanoarchaeota archaeon]
MGTYIEKLKDFEKQLEVRKEGPTITVSGLSGSGKSTIGKAIANAFGLKLKSMGDIFRELAKEKGIPIEKFSKIRSEEVDIELDKKTLELAKKGNIVLIGRLTGWVAGDNADVKLWIDCEDEVRFSRVAKREGISVEEAKKRILERDSADAKRYEELYGVDVNDKSIYDILFDNTTATYEEAITKPVEAIKELLDTTSN